MKNQLLFIVLLFILPINQLSSATYYLDFTNGSDSNDGLSPENAWKNHSKIRLSFPSPNDIFLFKRGEHWKGSQWYIDYSGTAIQPITFDTYGDTTDPLPIISSVDSFSNALMITNWTEITPNIWTLSITDSPGRLFLDNTEYLRADTISDVGLIDSEGERGYWFYDTTNNLLLLYATQNPATLYNTFEGSKLFNTVSTYNVKYLIFNNLDLQGGSGASIVFFGGQDIEVKNCKLGHSANSGISIINTTVNSNLQPSSNIVIADNTFDSGFTFFHGLGTERGCGDGVKLFYGANNCTVKNNTFLNWAHNAIELLGNKASGSGVNNNKFYDNQISAPDIPYAHPLGADGYLGKCQGNEFFRNYITDCRTASQINGNNNWVHHNIIRDMRQSPAKNQATAHAFIIGIYDSLLVSENNRFDHNLIIDTDESAFLIRGYGFTHSKAKNNSIRNNIIYDTGKDPYLNAYASGTALLIYDAEGGLDSNFYQNNLFYSSLDSNVIYIQDSLTYYSIPMFNSLNTSTPDSINNNIFSDPMFTNFADSNYFPLETSVVINAGIAVGLTEDFLLNNRFVDLAPDIGPYETFYESCPAIRIINDDSIVPFIYAAQDSIISSGKIDSSSSVIFKAGNSIILYPGFLADSGSVFHAYIESCSSPILFEKNQDSLVKEQPKKKEKAISNQKEITSNIVLKVYPNPATDNLTINFFLSKASPIRLSLSDLNGNILLNEDDLFAKERWQTKHLNIRKYPAGIYLFTLVCEKGIVSKKIFLID